MTAQDHVNAVWRKSTHSSSDGGNCTELAALGASVGVCDSKTSSSPVLKFSRREMSLLFQQLKST